MARGKAAAAKGSASETPAPAENEALLALTDEERIESAKYTPRELPARLFEEERFLFPETYGVDRVRLLVRDPEWLFAYWDVDPRSVQALRSDLGERAGALSRLSLRVFDPAGGGADLVLLPDDTRGWYVRTHPSRRSYQVELGFTLPSGEFRGLAVSNTVTAPSGRPSKERAHRRISYKVVRALPPSVPILEVGETYAAGPRAAGSGTAADATTVVVSGAQPNGPSTAASVPGSHPAKGGASDVFRPGGASDVNRR